MKEILMSGLFPILCGFIVCAAIGPFFIPILHRLKFGQEIRDEGPSWHKKKSGTPTMGGIMFIISVSVSVIGSFLISLFANNIDNHAKKTVLMLLISVGFGGIGFIDDFIKVVKKRNLGLRAAQKLLFQMILSVLYLIILNYMGELRCDIVIPFAKTIIHIPIWLYIIFALFVVVGTVNAVNLTDGLDGLASSVSAIVCIFFAVIGWKMREYGVYVFALSVFASLLGFLIFNKYPAKVFMGDTGSLFLGGAIVVMAIAMELHLILLLVGFIYFAETLSVIIQVASFKLTGKRVFKMSPIHHHFEMCGWRENKIVFVFSTVTVICCVIAYFSLI